MSNSCTDCSKKQFLINKYCKLIKLLNAKYNKTTKSSIKQKILTSQTLLETTQSDHNKLASTMSRKNDTLDLGLEFNTIQEGVMMRQKGHELVFKLIVNKSKKALLKCSFDKIKGFGIRQRKNLNGFQQEMKKSLNLNVGVTSSLIEQTLSMGKKLSEISIQNRNSNIINLKQLYSKIFSLQLQNNLQSKKIKKLQSQLSQSQKRFLKQTQKKRDSLQTVAEQIRQKTEYILELQLVIKKYEKALGKSLGVFNMENVLIQDQEELKKTCLRLENINQKLNNDIRIKEGVVNKLEKEIEGLNAEINRVKQENKQLREKNFDLVQELGRMKEGQNVNQKLFKKYSEKIKKFHVEERRLLKLMKNNFNTNLNSKEQQKDLPAINKKPSLHKSNDILSTKNTEIFQEDLQISKKINQIKHQQIEYKLQSIFSYIFNIENQAYKILNEQLFDQDEIKLLKSHKNVYLNNFNYINKFNLLSTMKNVKTEKMLGERGEECDENNFGNGNHNGEDSICYIQSPVVKNQDNSFFNALESSGIKTRLNFNQKQSNSQPSKKPLQQSQINQNIKIIDLQIQKSKLIQKISQLKNLHMHIRNVVLNLLKSLNLQMSTINKTDSENIMQIIFQFFEYSQDQKASIFKQKKKKFWGIL